MPQINTDSVPSPHSALPISSAVGGFTGTILGRIYLTFEFSLLLLGMRQKRLIHFAGLGVMDSVYNMPLEIREIG
jgi:hypothetical protein